MAELAQEPDVDTERRAFVSVLMEMRRHGFDDGFDAGLVYCAHLLEVAPDRIREVSRAAARRLHVARVAMDPVMQCRAHVAETPAGG